MRFHETILELLGKTVPIRRDTAHDPPRRWVDLIHYLEEQERQEREQTAQGSRSWIAKPRMAREKPRHAKHEAGLIILLMCAQSSRAGVRGSASFVCQIFGASGLV